MKVIFWPYVTKQGDRFVRVEDTAPSVPQEGATASAGKQAVDTIDYKTLKSGDVTPDGMIFVAVAGQGKALLRTAFNQMSHYDAEAKAEAEKHLGRRLPTLDELDMIRGAMTKKEIKALGNTFAWSALRTDGADADGMYLDDGIRNWNSRRSHAQVCLVRSVDL